MKLRKVMVILAAAVCMVMAMGSVAFAEHEVIDVDKTDCSLTVHLQTKAAKPIKGGTYTIWKVADVVYDNGDAIFVGIGAFKDLTRAELNSINEGQKGAPKLAKTCNNIVTSKGPKSVGNDKTNAKGVAYFANLTPGLYFVKNTKAAKGYYKAPYYCIAIPRYLKGTYVYDVDSKPKPPTAGKVPPPPHKIPHKLPQTGQLWWPVPVLAGFGVLFLLIGFLRRRRA